MITVYTKHTHLSSKLLILKFECLCVYNYEIYLNSRCIKYID